MKNTDIVFSHRLAGQVERYHTWPKLRGQSNGEHTWQVMRIYRELFGDPAAEVWAFIHDHDTPEIRTGDLPFSAEEPKKEWADVKASMKVLEGTVRNIMRLRDYGDTLTTIEKLRVKIADLLDCWEWGLSEMRLGSTYGIVVMGNVLPMARQLALKAGCSSILEGWLQEKIPEGEETD